MMKRPNSGIEPPMAVHLLLQGRYWLVILLVIVERRRRGIGIQHVERSFSSTGMIHIKPVIQTDAFRPHRPQPMFDRLCVAGVCSRASAWWTWRCRRSVAGP